VFRTSFDALLPTSCWRGRSYNKCLLIECICVFRRLQCCQLCSFHFLTDSPHQWRCRLFRRVANLVPTTFLIVAASRNVAVDHAQVEISTRHFPHCSRPWPAPLQRLVRDLGAKLGSFLASWHCRALTCSYGRATSKEVFLDTLDYCSWFCKLLPWTQLNELMSIFVHLGYY